MDKPFIAPPSAVPGQPTGTGAPPRYAELKEMHLIRPVRRHSKQAALPI